ncbi:hypothetical protein QBZ16_002398 [Prototheca wickerhamii]|uniref:Uncharacterized protein n=1 Tax=Prototheca wickerhamii TaxID=3111 RepID=A0AAD9IKI6_PROWI|nr:hypothetical protein QBZ16_002398 [Prototheca wickerhamii]
MLVAHRVSGGKVIGAAQAKRNSLLLTVEGEGAALHSVEKAAPSKVWALEGSKQRFTAPCAHDGPAGVYWAAVEDAGKASLRAWKGSAGSIPTEGVALPSTPQFLVPGAGSSSGPRVWALADHGGVHYCSQTAVLASAPGSGTPLVARPFQDGASLQVVSALSDELGQVRSCQYHFLVDTSAVYVLWADGSLATYSWSARGKGGDVDHLDPVDVVQLAGVSAPEPAAAPRTPAGRKRRASKAATSQAAPTGHTAALCLLPNVCVAAYWATSDSGTTVLRLTAIEQRYGAVLCCEDLGLEQGLEGCVPGSQIRVLPLGDNQVVLSVASGGCLALTLDTAAAGSLAGLIGSLALSSADAPAADAASGPALAAQRALKASTPAEAATSPPQVLEQPKGGSKATEAQLATPCSVTVWEECDAGQADHRRREGDRAGWALLADLRRPEAMSETDAVEALQPLLRQGAPVPGALHEDLLSAAVARGYYGLGVLEARRAYRRLAEAALARAQAARLSVHAAETLALAKLAAQAVEAFLPAQTPMHAVLAARLDGAQLEAALRALSARALPALVDVLQRWAATLTGLPPLAMGPDAAASYPSLQTLAVWLNALLDAGLMRLALTPALHAALGEVRACVERAARQARAWTAVRGGVESLLVRVSQPPTLTPAGRPVRRPERDVPRHTVELVNLVVA